MYFIENGLELDDIAVLSPANVNRILALLGSIRQSKQEELKPMLDEVNKDHSYAVKKSKVDFILFRDRIQTPAEVLQNATDYFRNQRVNIEKDECFKSKDKRREFLSETHSIYSASSRIIRIWTKVDR